MPTSPLTLTRGPVTVTFVWAGDRWSHVVAVRNLGTWESVEGPRLEDQDERWPASPVLVELASVETGGGTAILGVGRAGRSHFSASIGPDPAEPDGIRFEIACRVVEPAIWLGSTYMAKGGAATVRPTGAGPAELPATIEWAYSFGAVGLTACDRPGN